MKKNRPIDDLLFTLMRITVIQCILAGLFAGFSVAHDGRAQSAWAEKVSIDIRNQDVKKILRQIEKQTNVKFVFSSRLIQSDRKATVIADQVLLPEVLDKLLKPLHLQYNITNSLVVIKPDPGAGMAIEINLQNESNDFAQAIDRTITGTIKEETGNPLPGVTVVLKGTQTGALTDEKGNYSIIAPNGEATLIFSFVGFVSKEVVVPANENIVDASLKVDNKSLEEVVVVGYGTKKKEAIIGAVSTVTADDIARVHGGSTVSTALAGKLPGVSFRMSDGRPGAGANIQIRNMGNPLFVIDGIQQDVGQFNNLAANDIESISVLKDASAAVYGLRAANGVVVVTTKKGKLNTQGRINIDSYLGFQNWSRFPDVLNNSYDYMRYRAEAERNTSGSTSITAAELEKYKQGTERGYQSFNWKDFILKGNAPLNSVNLNATGGTDKVTYYVSFTNLFQNSQLGREYKFNRTNFQSNINAQVANGLKVGMNINGRIETRQNPGVPGGDDYNLAKYAIMRNTPLERPYANDNPAYLNDIKHNETNWAYLNNTLGGKFRSDWRVLQLNFSAEYQLPWVKGLSINGLYSYYLADLLYNNQEYTYVAYTYFPGRDAYDITFSNPNPWREREQVKQINTTSQVQLNYNRTFGKHTVSATVVNERILNNRLRNWIHSVPSTNVLPLIYFNTADRYDDSDDKQARIGYLGRVNYSYGNKYFIELAGRRDASYLFPPGQRTAFFPSVSAGWRLTEESWMQDWLNNDGKILRDLKIRASYGMLGDNGGDNPAGNLGLAPFAYLGGYNYNQGVAILGPQAAILGTRDRGVPTTNITWLKSRVTDIGLDFALLNGKLTGTFDYFYRKRTGLPAPKNDVFVPLEIGYTLPQENLNSDATYGQEFSLNYNSMVREVEFSVGGNFSYARNKSLFAYNQQYFNSWDQYQNSTINRLSRRGYGFETIGQFSSLEQISNYPVNIDGKGNSTLLPGDLIYKDLNNDGKINDYDQRPIAYERGRLPNINFGLNFSATYKGYDFRADFSGGAGFTWFQEAESRLAFLNGGNINTVLLDRWHRANEDSGSEWIAGKYPPLRFNQTDHSNNRPSTFWIHNVKYLRARTIELGYTVPTDIINKIKMNKARVYVNVYNLFSIDNLKQYGVDPEVNDANGLQLPQSRVFNVGVNLSF
jgi:TonB-linked SusC/RagA family outer membrane protein